VRLAAEQAAAVAVVTRQDAAALFAAQRLLSTLRACGAAEVRVWVAAYDTADSVTLAEMCALLGVPVEEAPPPPGHAAVTSAADPFTGALVGAAGEALPRSQVTASARAGFPLSVLFIDLDDLKRTNDAGGHAAGGRRSTTARIRTTPSSARWRRRPVEKWR